jgi:hypothetical protein
MAEPKVSATNSANPVNILSKDIKLIANSLTFLRVVRTFLAFM